MKAKYLLIFLLLIKLSAEAESFHPLHILEFTEVDKEYKASLGYGEEKYHLKGHGDPERVIYGMLGLEHRSSLGENYYLIWSPLPLGIGHKLPAIPNQISTVEWTLMGEVGNISWAFGPSFSAKNVQLLERNRSWFTSLGYDVLAAKGLSEPAWIVSLRSGPRWVFSDSLRLGTFLRPQIMSSSHARYVQQQDINNLGTVRKLGLGVDMSFMMTNNFYLTTETTTFYWEQVGLFSSDVSLKLEWKF